MKRLLISIAILFCCNVFVSAQNTVWYFGRNTSMTSSFGLDFTGVTPSSGTPVQRNFESAIDYYESVSVVSDNDGNVLFYTDGIYVYDASHTIIYGAPSKLLGTEATTDLASSVQGAYSLLKPGSETEYYLFTSGAIDRPSGTTGLRVNEIDMSLPGNGTTASPLGEMITSDVVLRPTSTEMMTAYSNCGTDTAWVITHEPNSWNFISILVTKDGIQSVNIQELETPRDPWSSGFSTDWGSPNGRGSMDISSDGSRLIMTGQNPVGSHILNFNRFTGEVSAPIAILDPTGAPWDGYGCEFSPDGTRAYFASNVTNGMFQYDVATDASTWITDADGDSHGEIITGNDNKLYIGKPAELGLTGIGVINDPNNPVGSINYNPDEHIFSGGVVSYAMPQGFYCPLSSCLIDMVVDQCDTVAPFQLTATPEGGTFGGGPYIDSAGIFSPLLAGEGTHWVTYDNGCEKPDSIQITVNTCVPPCFDTTLSNTIPPICVDETVDLSAYEVTSDGGTWSRVNTPSGSSPAVIIGESVFDATNADPGTYRIRFTLDSIVVGCPDSSERDIIVNAKPNISLTGGSFCAGDSVLLDAGNPGATYNWSNGETDQTQYFKTEGPHKVIVDLFGCIDSAEVTLTVIDTPSVSIIPPSASCSNDTIEDLVATPPGGEWSINDIIIDPGVFNPDSLGGGVHKIKYSVTDGGCSGIDSIEHTIDLSPEITGMPPSQSFCANEPLISLSANPPGGDWYVNGVLSGSDQFDPGAQDAGDYLIKYVVVNGAGCSDSSEVTFTVIDTPKVEISPILSACNNDGEETLNASPEGGLWYLNDALSTNIFNPSILGAGTYNLKYVFSGGSGCSDSAEVNVVIGEAPTIDLGPSTFFCSGDSILLDAGPGFTDIEWSNGDSIQTTYIKSPGLVSVVVSASNGCTETDQVNVTAEPLPSVDLGGTRIVCEDNFEELDATHPDGFSYSWLPISDFNPIITVGSENATYTVTIVGNNGCVFTDSVQIIEESLPTVSLGPDDIICDNLTKILDAASSSDVSYIWLLDGDTILDENSQTFEADSGEYIVIVSTENGCESSDTVNIDNHQLPIISLDDEYEFCEFDSVQIDLGPAPIGFSYLWSTEAVSESIWVKTKGTISVEVTDTNLCVNSATITITENPLPEINLAGSDSACEGREIPLDVEIPNGVLYEWTNAQMTLSHSNPQYTLEGPDTLQVKITTDKNCVDSATIEVKELSPLDLSDLGDTNKVCFQSEEDNPIDAGDFEEAEYFWTLPDESSEEGKIIVPYLEGDYELNVTDKFNCKGNAIVYNHVIKIPFVELGPDTFFCSLGKEEHTLRLSLTDTNVLGNITWSENNNNSNDTLFTATYTPITVIGTLTDIETGCSTKDTVELVEYCEPTVITFPNIFVPNGLTNNSFKPIELNEEILQELLNNILWSEFEVYNRWGIRVFQSQNTLPRWEGTFENRIAPTGTYYWIYRYKDSSVKVHSLNGYVQIVHQ